MDEETLKEARRQLAQSGGKAFVKKYGKNRMKELSQLAVEARKKKKEISK